MNTDRTANANLAPRCQHTKLNGSPCAAPARRDHKYCVFHEAAHSKRPDYTVRLVEDAMSLQLALFQVMRSLDDHALDPKRAALKLYALQIAASNLKRLHQEMDGQTTADDPARQQSLVELLLDQFGIPREEEEPREPAEACANIATPMPPTFDINACTGDFSPIFRHQRPKTCALRKSLDGRNSGLSACISEVCRGKYAGTGEQFSIEIRPGTLLLCAQVQPEFFARCDPPRSAASVPERFSAKQSLDIHVNQKTLFCVPSRSRTGVAGAAWGERDGGHGFHAQVFAN